MSEEEKKAIVLLTELRGLYEATAEDHKFRGTLSIQVDEDDSDAIATLLNLVEKQQEEIEGQEVLIWNLKKEIEIRKKRGLKQFDQSRKDYEKYQNDYISKDKIKDKIHEIGNETQYLLTDKGETKQNYAIRKFYELLEE